MALRHILVRDETLRDGAQQPGVNLTSKDRIEIALLVAEVLNSSVPTYRNQIDLGMPEVGDVSKTTIQQCVSVLKGFKGLDLFVTGRATKDAIDSMYESLKEADEEKRIIAPFIGISKSHREKLNLSKEQVLAKIDEALKYACSKVKRIHFPLEGGYYAYIEEKEFVYSIFELLTRAKVEAVPFCDTVGTALPFRSFGYLSYGDAIYDLRTKFPKVGISVHCHDDFGLAVANTLDGLISGAYIADGTFFGLGERAGNTSMQSLLTVLTQKGQSLGLSINANISNLYNTSQKIKKLLKLKVADNYPVVGKNSFSHASGIHQDGTLKNEAVYEPYSPKSVGRKGHKIVLSYLSGKNGIDHILKAKFGIFLEEKTLIEVAKRFKNVDSVSSPETKLIQIVHESLHKHNGQ